MLAVIRLRTGIKVRKDVRDTMDMLGVKRIHTLVILPEKKEIMGMIKKVENFVTWGELANDFSAKEKIIRLKPPKGGLRSIKQMYPKGDLGYRGKEINELIKRMM